MKRRNILLIAGAAVGVGALLIVAAFAMTGFDPQKLQTTNVETVSEDHAFPETISGVDIQTVSSDVRFAASSDGTARVESRHSAQITETVEVKNGILTVRQKQAKQGPKIGIDLSAEDDCLTVYLPGSELDSLSVQTVSGDMELGGLSAKGASLESVSGELELKELIVSGKLTVGTVSGDVDLDRCDAGEIDIVTVSGEVEGTLLSPKQFDVHTISGKLDVPASESGAARCTISTTSGDVELKLAR